MLSDVHGCKSLFYQTETLLAFVVAKILIATYYVYQKIILYKLY